MPLSSPIFTEDGSHLHRFAFLAAQEVLLVARKWRNEIEQLGLNRLDLSRAKSKLDDAVLSLQICLAPPVADGVAIDPRDNPRWRDLPDVEQVNMAEELAEARGAEFSALGFSGRSAHEVVYKLGQATLGAMRWLAGARDDTTLNWLLGPESHLRTETQGLGAIPAAEANRVEAACLWEAERAWRAAKEALATNPEAAKAIALPRPPVVEEGAHHTQEGVAMGEAGLLDPITLKEAAVLVQAEVQTIYNKMSEDKGEKPAPAVPKMGQRAAIYRYAELRPWLLENFPKMAHRLPEEFQAARVLFS